jgi:hypothetical protein
MSQKNKFVVKEFAEVEGGYYDCDFYYTPNGSFWDDEGYYFNKEGKDKHGGYYDKNFKYVPGETWDEENECYLSEVELNEVKGDNGYYDPEEEDDLDDFDYDYENFTKKGVKDDFEDDYGIEDDEIKGTAKVIKSDVKTQSNFDKNSYEKSVVKPNNKATFSVDLGLGEESGNLISLGGEGDVKPIDAPKKNRLNDLFASSVS